MAKKTRQKRRTSTSRRPATPAPPKGAGSTDRAASAAGMGGAGAGPRGGAAGAGAAGAAAGAAGAPTGAAGAAAGTAVGGTGVPVREGRRGVERVQPGAQRRAARPAAGAGAAAGGFAPLDPADAAIPFDRVPYVRSDLRRVAVMAGIMVVLIIVANLVVSRITG